MLALASIGVGASEPLSLDVSLKRIAGGAPPETVDDLRALQEGVRRVVWMAQPATVQVEMGDSVGSGVVISSYGLVLTAGHVSFEPDQKVGVRFPNGERYEGHTLGVNHPVDSGALVITSPPPDEAGWPFVPLAKEDVELGEWVVALGQPNGFVPGRTPPVRLGRVLRSRDDTLGTDATLVGGDSGGPLFNLRGEVVGIHSRIGERITSNYHVKASAFRRDWRALMEGRLEGIPDGEEEDDWGPLSGIALRQVGSMLVVTQVFPESAAERAGLLAGDQVLKVNGRKIEGLGQLGRLARRIEAYDRLELTVLRGEQELSLSLWVGRGSRSFPGTIPQGFQPHTLGGFLPAPTGGVE
jgi:serine protease Do